MLGIVGIAERSGGGIVITRSGGSATVESKEEGWSARADIYKGRVVAKLTGVARVRLYVRLWFSL
jgi:hypothetical protein